MHKLVLSAGLLWWFLSPAFSQNEALPCGHVEATEALRAKYPWILESETAYPDNEGHAEPEGAERNVKIIPVVVHILHNYGPENISDAQVHDAIRILNEDFQRRQPDSAFIASSFKNIFGNPNFEFRLARKDPNGNCTNGITRTVTTHTFNAGEEAKTIVPAWPRNRYMNVWVVQKLESGAGGYTYTPGTAQWIPDVDGIILVNRQFGSIGTSMGGGLARRTLTHEVGHWFNLQHTWGATNNPGLSSNCDTDDGVSDTPNTLGVVNQGCNLSQITCNSLDNVQNIMDYSSCPIMFTNGQASRMNAAANSNTAQRSDLWTASNLSFTGTSDGFADTLCAPIADFHSSLRIVCAGGSVSFTDLSHNGTVESRNWTFSNVSDGTTVITSTEQNPVINFSVPGIYSVSLTASNGEGSSSRTKANYLRVYPAEAIVSANGFVEDFEGDFESMGWFSVNDNGNGWQISTDASLSGSRSMVVQNFLSGNNPETHNLITPSFDLTKVSNPKLVFKYAYARRNSDSDDRLRVFVSNNCGASWVQLVPPISNSQMVTAPPVADNFFVPTLIQWAEKEFNISSTFANSTNVRFRFEFSSRGGNNFYLDDVNIPGIAGFNREQQSDKYWEMYPNPAYDYVEFRFNFNEPPASLSIIEIYDAAGRIMNSYRLSENFRLDVSTFNPGIYFVKIRNNSSLEMKKLIIR